jgi:hypothetical protein
MLGNAGQIQNAPSSSVPSEEFHSNVRLLSSQHLQNASGPMVLTERGTQIDDSDWHPQNASLLIVVNFDSASN